MLIHSRFLWRPVLTTFELRILIWLKKIWSSALRWWPKNLVTSVANHLTWTCFDENMRLTTAPQISQFGQHVISSKWFEKRYQVFCEKGPSCRLPKHIATSHVYTANHMYLLWWDHAPCIYPTSHNLANSRDCFVQDVIQPFRTPILVL